MPGTDGADARRWLDMDRSVERVRATVTACRDGIPPVTTPGGATKETPEGEDRSPDRSVAEVGKLPVVGASGLVTTAAAGGGGIRATDPTLVEADRTDGEPAEWSWSDRCCGHGVMNRRSRTRVNGGCPRSV